MDLKNRNFITLLDFTPEEIDYLIVLSSRLKSEKYEGIPHRHLSDKNIVLLFQKDSTRTRCAFEVGALDLGMGVTFRPEILGNAPLIIQQIFGSAITTGGLTAIFLNIVLPQSLRKQSSGSNPLGDMS